MGTTLTGTTPQDTYDSLIKVTDNGPISGTAKFLSDGLGNDSALALSTSGVGIGTTSSSLFGTTGFGRVLGVVASSNYAVVQVGGAAATGGEIDFGAGSIRQGAVASLDGSSLAFYTNPTNAGNGLTERMRITSTGNVGIGTSAPLQKLGIDGSIVLQSSDVASKSLIFRSPSSNWGPQNSRIDFIPADGVNAATDISINLWNGNGGIPETLRFPSSGGIRFPATQISSADSNTLDDYEEGTWTMGISFGGASVGVTTSTNTGSYTKIGRQVTVNGYIVLTSKGSSTGNAGITGLPFTVANGNQFFSGAALRFSDITFADHPQGQVQANTTTILLTETTNLGATTDLLNTDFANNSQVMVSATYFV